MAKVAVLDELLVRLGVDMSDAESEVEQGADGITSRLDGLTVAGGAAAAGLGAAFVMGLEGAMDISSVTTQLQNQLDLTDEEAGRAGTIAGDVFADGFGGSMDEVGEALGAVSSSMQEFGSISDAEMQDLTKQAMAVAKTFQFDVGEAAVGAGNLIKAGLAKDGTEALDLITAAAQQMPKAMAEELPAVTKEYSEFFGQLGFTGPQMFGLLTEAAKNPAFEIDKLGDAIKEFSLRIADTDAVTEPLKELGLDVGHIQKLVNTGHGTKAFDEVNDALLKVTDQTKRTMLQAALFGGPGEDLGSTLQAVAQAGGAAGANMGDFAGKAGEAAAAMEASPAQQWDSVMRSLSTTLGTALLPALQFVSELMKEHPGLVQVLVPIVLALAAGLAVAAAAQWALNSALLANPYTWIVLAIVAIVAAIVVLWKKNEAFRNFVTAAWNTILGAIKKAWNWVKNNWPLVLGILTGPIGLAVGAITNYWDDIVKFFKGIPGRISKIASGMWTPIWNDFKHTLNTIIWGWNNLSLTIGGGSIMGVDIPSITLSTPNIPYLAKGGIATGPTLAMVGEGREDEAILPLSRLEQMLNRPAAAPSTRLIQPVENRLVLELRGGSRAFREFFQESVRTTAGGDIRKFTEG
ncbi:phage tail tape measure protein [Streptomyces sp. NPDC017936]|uniref:phage tail tape measure protein n=1 Tax=Streptomyces sp. NPDC017936 TaxID=3365016 RepID=UPI0037B84AB1